MATTAVNFSRMRREKERRLKSSIHSLMRQREGMMKRLEGMKAKEERIARAQTLKRARELGVEPVLEEKKAEPPVKRPRLLSSVVVVPQKEKKEKEEEPMDVDMKEKKEKEKEEKEQKEEQKDDSLKRPREAEEGKERKAPRIASTVAVVTKTAPAAKKPVDQAAEATRKRNRRMFGGLLMGTLKRAKKESEIEAKSEVVEVRKQMEEELDASIVSKKTKLIEMRKEERESIRIELEENLAGTEERLKVEKQALTDLKQAEQDWLLSGYAKTKTLPSLYFIPKTVDSFSKKAYDISEREALATEFEAEEENGDAKETQEERAEASAVDGVEGVQVEIVNSTASPARSRSPSPSPKRSSSPARSRSPSPSRSHSRSG
eukprot:TRINITY_DN2378_c0_g1_i3.p1 TRINITY_DN2378_c0_g1~~TRINITY_DN2378_c0_g1_i3.p1  ORF type:complete len:389 (-),score=164.37 TRINITY_DN2378_c0_g1_i3:118-1245(-)